MLNRIAANGLTRADRQYGRNRPGAGGNLGAEFVMRAPADGYTLLMGPTSVYAAGASLFPSRSFDVLRDFTAICTLASVPHVLVVAADVGAESLADLIRRARSQPKALSLASQGVGTISHLEGELFQFLAGVSFVHVPYKGSAPAHLDLLGKRVHLMFDSIAAALPHIRAGKLRALGVTTPRRVSTLPDVPTIAEAGLPGFAAESWVGVLVPARVPRTVVDRLSREIAAVVTDPSVVARLSAQGFEARAIAGADYTALIQREISHWAVVIKRAGITLE
ncbi:MAG: tripartite tricarboxylate transporter substrate-binding protein [Burkholderiales bacterium]